MVDNSLVGVDHFRAYGVQVNSKKSPKFRYLFWIATSWCIWFHRNNVVFRGLVFDARVNHIKSISWEWFISIVGRNLDLVLHNWWAKPLDCLCSL